MGKQTNAIYKMMSTWLRKHKSILVFMSKEIKETRRETGRKMLEEQWSRNLLQKRQHD